MRRHRVLTAVLVLVVGGLADAQSPRSVCRELRQFNATEAKQAVAVDEVHCYVVTNRAVGKYDKRSGKRVADWQATDDSSIRHLNSGVVEGGKLYCAHSNWPAEPLENSIEIWDAATLTHIGRRQFDESEGAVTWIDRHNGTWWIVFAHYGEVAEVSRTTLVSLDDQWQQLGTWRFPREVVVRFVPYSNSGGSWGPDGFLYTTGHDRAELYALRVPENGPTLELVATVPMSIGGQGLAWDRSDLGIVYGIRRRSREVVVSRLSHTDEYNMLAQPVVWQRDPQNPVLPPGDKESFDATRCMNPWALAIGEKIHLYYSGGDKQGRQRICLATAPANDPRAWKRHGPLFETGSPGSFDARWCVLPHVVQIAPDRWHLYYTGNAGSGSGLSAFPGIGLAISRDGKSWAKIGDNPVIGPSRRHGDADAIGIAGGSVLRVRTSVGDASQDSTLSPADQRFEWRFYYTGCPTVGDPLPLNQQKTVCLATSEDGIRWRKRGPVMFRDPARDYENIGVAGPVVHQQRDGSFRMWYSAIGTRWGYYSICYAESADGIHWRRGARYGDNLQLTPTGDGWERQMVEYPSIVRQGDLLRLFYCGNGYGRTGIGTARSDQE